MFNSLRSRGEGALVGFTTAGDPDPKGSMKIAQALIDGGVDVLELGIPFSDPIADGPSIQQSSSRALSSGTTPQTVLDMARQLKPQRNIPIVLLTYYNIIYHTGLEQFFAKAKERRVDGIVVPDLPIDEADEYRAAANKAKVGTIFLATPATPDPRLKRIVECSSGFIYLVSVYGVTGARSEIQNITLETLQRVKRLTDLPVAVGFGVSKPEHVEKLVSSGADGVIVGSLFADIIGRHLGNLEETCNIIKQTASALKQATKRAAIAHI
ncbi:MAG: tryptophan synthase subunit alpha [Thaumarchaeota archaeon]|nr:tryptophan synthase subunit alpha [Nitrososphaerota archaeon]